MNNKREYILFFLIIISVILFQSCKKENPAEPVSGLVFLEYSHNVNGELIEGKYPEGPNTETRVTYHFNSQDRSIKCYSNDFDVNQVNALLGYNYSLSGLAGAGLIGSLFGIIQIPDTINNIEIRNIDNFGTAEINFKGTLIELKINEEWADTSSVISVQDSGKARIITTDIIKNYGFISRKNVTN